MDRESYVWKKQQVVLGRLLSLLLHLQGWESLLQALLAQLLEQEKAGRHKAIFLCLTRGLQSWPVSKSIRLPQLKTNPLCARKKTEEKASCFSKPLKHPESLVISKQLDATCYFHGTHILPLELPSEPGLISCCVFQWSVSCPLESQLL